MTNRLLLHLFVYQDLVTGEVTTSADAHPMVPLDIALDGKVSLAAQLALAEVSPAYAAELEASTHFLERLEQITVNATQGQFDDADPSILEPPD